MHREVEKRRKVERTRRKKERDEKCRVYMTKREGKRERGRDRKMIERGR